MALFQLKSGWYSVLEEYKQTNRKHTESYVCLLRQRKTLFWKAEQSSINNNNTNRTLDSNKINVSLLCRLLLINRNQVVSIDICILMSYIICQYSILKLFVLECVHSQRFFVVFVLLLFWLRLRLLLLLLLSLLFLREQSLLAASVALGFESTFDSPGPDGGSVFIMYASVLVSYLITYVWISFWLLVKSSRCGCCFVRRHHRNRCHCFVSNSHQTNLVCCYNFYVFFVVVVLLFTTHRSFCAAFKTRTTERN